MSINRWHQLQWIISLDRTRDISPPRSTLNVSLCVDGLYYATIPRIQSGGEYLFDSIKCGLNPFFSIYKPNTSTHQLYIREFYLNILTVCPNYALNGEEIEII
jgi:hypothetical protein